MLLGHRHDWIASQTLCVPMNVLIYKLTFLYIYVAMLTLASLSLTAR